MRDQASPEVDSSARAADPITLPDEALSDLVEEQTDEIVDPEGDVTDPMGIEMLDDPPTLENPVIARIERTDDKLRDWRGESEKRKAEWTEAQALEAEARHQRMRKRGAAAALVLGFVSSIAAGIVLLDFTGTAQVAAPADEAQPAEAEAVEEAPIAAERVVEEEPPEAVETEAVVAEPEAAPAKEPVVASVAIRDARLWEAMDHHWVRFQVTSDEPVSIRWLDAAGVQGLEDMACSRGRAGTRNCYAGRSQQRIGFALANGAAAGAWTVHACTPADCALVGTFDTHAE